MIKKFKETEGRYIEKILGQDRLAFAHSDTSDFYDLIEWSKAGGYQGSIIMFFDFDSGKRCGKGNGTQYRGSQLI